MTESKLDREDSEIERYERTLQYIEEIALKGCNQAINRNQRELKEKFDLIISVARHRYKVYTDEELEDD